MLVATLLVGVLFGLASSASAQGTLTVAWDANPESDVTGYIIEYGTTSGNYPFSVDVGNQTQYTLTGLTPGATYYLVVRAYNSAGVRSPRSAEVSGVATTPIHRLTLSHTGQGAGSVTSTPAGINCGADCTEDYLWSTVVTLNATPATGSTFAGWFGHGDCNDGSVTMTADKSCNARFVPEQTSDDDPGSGSGDGPGDPPQTHTLTVNRAGDGSGTVSSSPAGINCGVDCSESYTEGTVVNLTATTQNGSSFDGWSGHSDCGNGSLTMHAARTCTATFSLVAAPDDPPGDGSDGTDGGPDDTPDDTEDPSTSHNLTVIRDGDGSGVVTSSPEGIACGANCSESYAEAAVVTLTATSDPGSSFGGWGGHADCVDGTVMMVSARSCTATFELSDAPQESPGEPTVSEGTSGTATAMDFDGDGTADLATFVPATGEWRIVSSSDSSSPLASPAAVGSTSRQRTTIVDLSHLGGGLIPVPGDYDGDGVVDVAVWLPVDGRWHVYTAASGFASGPVSVWGKAGDVPVPGDYDGDGVTDRAFFRPSTGTWHIIGMTTIRHGQPGDIPVPADYDGDGMTEIAVFRPWKGTWLVSGAASVKWGRPGDTPVPADYDGDGAADFGVFRRATARWLVRGQFNRLGGRIGDIPVPLDLDGDGKVELVTYNPADAAWRAHDGANVAAANGEVSRVGEVPAVVRARIHSTQGDFDADGRSDLTLYRESKTRWLGRLSSSEFKERFSVTFGSEHAEPAPGDYDGDGFTDLSVYRPRNGTWIVKTSSSDFKQLLLHRGLAHDAVPVQADYDGDGRTDVATYEPDSGRWTVRPSSSEETLEFNWGYPGDVPFAGDWDGDGRADAATYTPSLGIWSALLSTTDYVTTTAVLMDPNLGLESGPQQASSFLRGAQSVAVSALQGVPVAVDVEGDGRVDAGRYNTDTGHWEFLLSSSDYETRFEFEGAPDGIPVPSDYLGRGWATLGTYHPSSGTWHIDGLPPVSVGNHVDQPLTAPPNP